MKTIGTRLIFISALSLGPGGCLTHSNMSKQMTILNTDCEMKDISISNEREELNTTRNWTAECNGKTYQCNSHEDGDSVCHEVAE